MPTSGCFLASTACVSSVTMWLHRIWSYLISRVQLIDLQLIIEYSLSNKHFRCNLEWKSPYVLYMLNSSHQFKCECAFRMQVFLTWYLLSRFSFYCKEDADIGVHAVNAITRWYGNWNSEAVFLSWEPVTWLHCCIFRTKVYWQFFSQANVWCRKSMQKIFKKKGGGLHILHLFLKTLPKGAQSFSLWE